MKAMQPTKEYVRELLDYDPLTGILRWKPRSESRFASASLADSWNKQYAGKVAGRLGSNGYRYIKIEKVNYREHRIIWLWVHGEWPPQVDHDDRDTSNNRLSNLKKATNVTNSKNKGLRSDNTSGIPGVQWSDRKQRWTVEIYVDGARKYVGQFREKGDAVTARKNAERQHGYHPNHGIPD